MGVLSGYKIIELSGIGPGPLCGMLFADLGAEVIRVDRKNTVMPNQQPKFDITGRSKKSICLNLKDPESKEVLFKLIKNADALIEGYRPGVTVNPSRLNGWKYWKLNLIINMAMNCKQQAISWRFLMKKSSYT